MKRVSIGEGQWFDADTALRFDEDTWWDGRNHISRATGSQWDHENLYYTKSGRWVLKHWSQWECKATWYEVIEEDQAVRWLVDMEQLKCATFFHLPEGVQKSCESLVASLEV